MKSGMRTFLAAIVAIVLAGCIVSCNKDSRKLRSVDDIIESDPQRALSELGQLTANALSPEDSAYYALLYTQAQVKCGEVVCSDSLISVAYDAYGRNGNDDLRKRACFYNSKVSYNNGDLRNAMKDALVAYEIANNEGSPYWIAKSAELMADIFFDAFNYQQSEIYTHEAADYYEKSGRTDNHRYTLCDLASVYLNENRKEEAIALLDSLEDVVRMEEPMDSALAEYLMVTRGSALVGTDRINEINGGSSIDLETKTDREEVSVSITNSFVLNSTSGIESATKLLSEAYRVAEDDKERIQIMYAMYRQALDSENYKQAAKMSDSLLLMQSNIAEEILKESVTGVQRDYFAAKGEAQQRRAKLMLWLLATVVAVAIVITSLLIHIYRLRIRANRAELEASLSSLMHSKSQVEKVTSENIWLHSELEKKSADVKEMQKTLYDKISVEEQNSIVIEHLFREKWDTLNMLCSHYFEMGESDKTRAAVLSNIEKELKKLKTGNTLKDIEYAVDRYMGNIMSFLREECTFFKEDDFVFLSLVFAGLNVRTVCLFLDIKYKLFYLKKSRLIKRIEDSAVLHRDAFLSRLKQKSDL